MKLNSLEVKKLYGYLDKFIQFDSGINLMVGINGSGKTSVLNLINWVLTPSIPNLCTTEFESIKLDLDFKDNNYTIFVTQSDDLLKYFVTNNTTGKIFNHLKVSLDVPPKELDELQRKRTFKNYEGLRPDSTETKTWSFVFKELPKPLVIGLDRYLYIEDNGKYQVIDDNHYHYVQDKAEKTSPLINIRKLANKEYNIYKSKLVDLNQSLINKIMLSAFDEITDDFLYELENVPPIKIEHVDMLHKRVEAFFKENIKGNIHLNSKSDELSFDKIERYFNNLKSVIEKAQDRDNKRFDLLYITNINQFKKLNKLIKEFETFDKKNQEAYYNINIYLETINRFLKDSSKILTYRDSVSELVFDVFDTKGKIISRNRDIDTLSSGEKQILILLTHLKFTSRKDIIFIIDEPELSLHPKWQEEFLEAVRAILHKNTQVIIATHSPIIVGHHDELVKVLLPYSS